VLIRDSRFEIDKPHKIPNPESCLRAAPRDGVSGYKTADSRSRKRDDGCGVFGHTLPAECRGCVAGKQHAKKRVRHYAAADIYMNVLEWNSIKRNWGML
jgi:hypothetical protein